MEASVIVATRNRARLLEITLQSLAAQTLDRSSFEVLIVDNASTDSTPSVAARWREAGPFVCRTLHEERLGVNHARNRGIAEAQSRVIAFVDDDARAEPGWLEALLSALDEERVSGVGGRIKLWWESRPPPWLAHRTFFRLLAEFDLGDQRRRVEKFPYLVATNTAFTAEAFTRFGGFSTELSRRGALSPLGMEDVELCHRVVKGGGALIYEPRAVVHHLVPDDRARLSFLLRRSYADGRSLVRYQKITGDPDREGSRPQLLARSLAELPLQVMRRNWVESARAMVQAARHLGYLREAYTATH